MFFKCLVKKFSLETVHWWLMALTMMFASVGFAEEMVKKYPPYPDVWGRKLSIEAMNGFSSYPIDTFRLPDGDILMVYPKFRNKTKFLFGGESFFSGNHWGIEVEKLMNSLPNSEAALGNINNISVIFFKNGMSLHQEINHPLDCHDQVNIAFVLVSKEGAVLWKKKLIHVIPNPNQETKNTLCENSPVTFTRRLETIIWEVTLLEDDTFIMVAGNAETPYVFRFDQSFKTLFLLTDEWVVVDAVDWDKQSEILLMKTMGDQQAMIDAQYQYLKTLIKRENNHE